MAIWTFVLIYFLGIVVGVLASLLLNVQLRRPGLSKSIALGVLGLLLAVFLAAHNTTMPEWLLALLWDDNMHVTRLDLRSLHGLWRIWFELGATQQYYPLLHSMFWLEHQLWGDATLGYHLVNILLHASAACLFAAVLRRLKVPGAGLAGLLFALHPVCVESVA